MTCPLSVGSQVDRDDECVSLEMCAPLGRRSWAGRGRKTCGSPANAMDLQTEHEAGPAQERAEAPGLGLGELTMHCC